MVIIKEDCAPLLKLAEVAKLMSALDDRCVLLGMRQEDINQNKTLEADVKEWSVAVAKHLETLIEVLNTHKSFDPEALSFQFTNDQRQIHKMRKFSKQLLENLEQYESTAILYQEMNGQACLYVFRDLLNQTEQWVREAASIFEKNNLQDRAEYLALTEYLQNIDPFISLFNDCVNSFSNQPKL